jgi:hypothetical protein
MTASQEACNGTDAEGKNVAEFLDEEVSEREVMECVKPRHEHSQRRTCEEDRANGS